MIKDYLTDLEIEKIEAFCTDEAMLEAVRKVLLAGVYYSGALKKGEKLEPKNQAFDLISKSYTSGTELSDQLLGQGIRGLFEGVNMVEQAFGHLKTIKKPKANVETPYNEAI